ncbi:OsmC family protein [Stutzerimonas urumqiensis]|uniref:OsmC family protein n=1 Tax=Stutzerimonas urumqiensis TaxID=638269 RepID=UPI000EB1231B|nr:OsmC family protein [Stutzerimonas urumqiensis]
MKKSASAIWQGSLKEGKGTISTQSGALDGNPYGFNTRFEGAPGTNPEELIGAAHAGCFSMALSMMLGQAGLTPERIETKAEVTLDKQGEGFAITAIDLQLKARVPGADEAQFQTIANQAKEGCPVSKVLNATITLSATLER